jgi:serine/threonine protein kinase
MWLRKKQREKTAVKRIDAFDFHPGRRLVGKYEVIGRIGTGWEGEVYRVVETATGIERAAKFFYPHRNERNRAVNFYAKKLNALRKCPILIQYHTQESMRYRRHPITFLISDYVEGMLLTEFLKQQRGKRLPVFEALHLLHALASGIEVIHRLREYHGDLHSENVIVRRLGIGFDVKLVDMFHWGPPSAANTRDDVIDLIKLFHECLGGQKHYAQLRPEIKSIICGLKQSLILAKFKTAGKLREHLENMEWEFP